LEVGAFDHVVAGNAGQILGLLLFEFGNVVCFIGLALLQHVRFEYVEDFAEAFGPHLNEELLDEADYNVAELEGRLLTEFRQLSLQELQHVYE